MVMKFIVLIVILQLSACSIVKRQYGDVIANEQSTSVSPKDYHQLLLDMGAPDTVAVLNDAFIFAYHSVTIREPQFGITIPYYDLFKLNLGSATARHNYHFYAFDLMGNSINLSQFNWHNELGDGSAIGLIFIVEETVDLSHFKAPKEANLWGKQLLIDKELAEFSFAEIIAGNRLDLFGQTF